MSDVGDRGLQGGTLRGWAALMLVFMGLWSQAPGGAVEVWRAGDLAGRYQTIQEGIDEAEPGDTVRVRSGVYYETIRVDGKHGSKTRPFVLEGAPGEDVLIDGAWEAAVEPQGGVWTQEGETGNWYAEVPGDARYYAIPAFADGEKMIFKTRTMEEFAEGPDDRLPTRFFREDSGRAWIRLNAGRSDPNRVGLLVPTDDFVLDVSDSSYWTFRNFRIRTGGRSVIHVADGAAHHCVFEDLDVGTGQFGFLTEELGSREEAPHHLVVRRCRFVTHPDPLWWRDDIYQNPYTSDHNPMATFNVGIEAAESEVANCLLDGSWDAASIHGWDLSFHDCVMRNIFDDAVEFDCGFNRTVENVRFYNNLIYDALVGLSVTCGPGPLYIYRNVISANKEVRYDYPNRMHQGIYAFKIAKATWGPLENVKIYHNSVFGINYVAMDSPWKGEGPGIESTEWLNNVLLSQEHSCMTESGLESTGVRYNGNCWHSMAGYSVSSDWNGRGKVATIEEIRERSPWEEDGMVADPKVADLRTAFGAANLLLLAPDSPCIDKGVRLPEGWPDSVEIGDGLPDIGAHEVDPLSGAVEEWRRKARRD